MCPEFFLKRVFPLFIVLVLGLALHLWRLSAPPRFVFDEVYYVPAARALLQNKPDPNWVHPPLGKVLIGASIKLFGDKPWAWRFPSAAAAALAAGFFFLLARDLFKSSFIAFYASSLYLLDGLTFVQARLAMLDMMSVGFLLPAIYFFRKERYFLSSIFFAAAVLCKWTALFALPIFLISMVPLSGAKIKKSLIQFSIPSILLYILIFVFLGGAGHSWKNLFTLHLNAIKFHLRPTMEHPYKAPWWKWLLLIRPIWYYYKEHGEVMRGIVALPNPLLWWPSVLSVLVLCFRMKKEESRFIFLGIISFLVPWIFSPRGGFLYYLLPLSPFLILSLVEITRTNRILMAASFTLALFGFILFFPIYSDWPISKNHYNHLIWLKSWV